MNLKRCAVMGLLLLVVGCGGERGIMMGMLCVSQEQFGDQWPLYHFFKDVLEIKNVKSQTIL